MPEPSAASRFEEGDRCVGCGHWWWRDDHWHTLIPITYADHPELAREVECPTCEGGDIGGHGPISTRGTRPWHGHLEHGIWRSV